MVSSVTETTDTASSVSAAMKTSMGMDSDDFMKLFIAQLQYQDPLAPQDPSAMLDQLSQLTMVEQSYNTTTALDNLLTAQNNTANLSAVSFIGKEIKANGNSISFDGASPAGLQFNQAVATASNEISVINSDGTVVRTITTGGLASGDNSVTWDGCDSSGTLLPAGNYSFSVKGKTNSGNEDVTGTTYTSGRVDGITFNNGNSMLTIGSVIIPFSDVISVGEV